MSHHPDPVSTAYERYWASIFEGSTFAYKVMMAVLGLEAVYLRPMEPQEAEYRLALRISKVMSKLDMKVAEVQQRVNLGYRIRSLHIRGGELGHKENSAITKLGLAPETLTAHLINYLRLSLQHFLYSKQDKAEFLDLVDGSLVDMVKDDQLRCLIKSEAEELFRPLP